MAHGLGFSAGDQTGLHTAAFIPAGIWSVASCQTWIHTMVEHEAGIRTVGEYEAGLYTLGECEAGIHTVVEYEAGLHAMVVREARIHRATAVLLAPTNAMAARLRQCSSVLATAKSESFCARLGKQRQTDPLDSAFSESHP
jgi:hypothetical protein